MADKRKAGVVLSDADMKKRYNTGLASKILLPSEDTLWLPSRIPHLNWHLGGGIKYGSIMELFGGESTGKTLLAMDFGAVAQSLGGLILWADAEGTFDPFWASKNGIDLDKLYILPEENSVEAISDWIADMSITARSKLTNNEPILLVVDSIAALETLDNIETSQQDSKAEMGKRAGAIYSMLRRRNKFLIKYGINCICINQLRQKVGASKYEDPDTTPGGKAMAFYASQRLGLYQGKQIKNKKDIKIGQNLYVRTKKNKVAPPRPRIMTAVHFMKHQGLLGYNPYVGLQDILLDLDIVKRKQARWYYKGEQIAHGDEKMLEVLSTNDNLRRKLLRKAGMNTVSQTRAKIESIKKNLYPVAAKKKKKDASEE